MSPLLRIPLFPQVFATAQIAKKASGGERGKVILWALPKVGKKEMPMKRIVAKCLLVLTLCAATVAIPMRAMADDWPMVQGDFWDVTGVHLKDGGALTYATFLATDWKADQEFAKSKGWIKAYMVLSNAYPRKGEPDLYLVTITERLASGPEGEKRNEEYMAWRKKSSAQMQKESGNRLEVREILSSSLLQELKFRK